MVVQPGLCGNWSETPKTGFLTTRLKYPIRQLKLWITLSRMNYCLIAYEWNGRCLADILINDEGHTSLMVVLEFIVTTLQLLLKE